MTAYDPLQDIPFPEPGDPPDGPNQFAALVDAVAGRLAMRFGSEAERDARVTFPADGMLATTGNGSTSTLWMYRNGAWRAIYSDTGWFALTANSPNSLSPGGWVRRTGDWVQVRVRGVLGVDVPSAQSTVLTATVPEWARPPSSGTWGTLPALADAGTGVIAYGRVMLGAQAGELRVYNRATTQMVSGSAVVIQGGYWAT